MVREDGGVGVNVGVSVGLGISSGLAKPGPRPGGGVVVGVSVGMGGGVQQFSHRNPSQLNVPLPLFGQSQVVPE